MTRSRCAGSRVPEAHAVAGGDVDGPVAHDLGELDDRGVAAEGLVGVDVDAHPASLRQREQAAQVGARVGREVRRAAHEVDAQVEGGLDVGILRLGSGERHQLDVHEVAQLFAHLHQRPHATQRFVAREDVDVAPHGGRAVAQQQQGGLAGAVGDALDSHDRGVGLPRRDGEAEVAHRRVDEVPGEGLVEVRVRLGGSGEQQESGEVEARGIRPGTAGVDAGDEAVGQLDVDDGAVGQRGVGEEVEAAREAGHGASPPAFSTDRATVSTVDPAALEC